MRKLIDQVIKENCNKCILELMLETGWRKYSLWI